MSNLFTKDTSVYYQGIKLDSMEEFYMCHWLKEAKDAGFVKDWNIVTESIVVLNQTEFTSIQGVSKKINGLSYTADFNIEWHPSAIGIFIGIIPKTKGSRKLPYTFYCDQDLKSMIDVKPAFLAARLNSNITFPIVQKLLYNTHKVYVQKVVVTDENNLFHKTYAPIEYFLTPKTRIARKLKIKHNTLKEFLHASTRI
jgi:hypothetical protein